MPTNILDLSTADGNIQVPREISNFSRLSPVELSLSPQRDDYVNLRNTIAHYYDVPETFISLGNGSDEMIEMIASIYDGGTNISVMPAFERLYEVNRKQNSKVEPFFLNKEDAYRYTHEQHAVLLNNIAMLEPRIVWLCSPNNPTGETMSLGHISELADACTKGVVVIDEAFIDFTETHSAKSLIPTHDNVIVLNSFSKSWGLSALRIGFALASENITNILNEHTTMFNINKPAVILATQCLKNDSYRKQEFAIIRKNRAYLLSELENFPDIDVISHASINILCIGDVDRDLHRLLINKGIKTKSLSRMYGMEDSMYCRILIPRKEYDTNFLIKALKEIYS